MTRISSRKLIPSVVLSLLCIVSLWPAAVAQSAELVLRDHGYMRQRFHDKHNWASVSVKNGAGQWITGLTLGDFRVTETLISTTEGVVAGPHELDIASQAQQHWTESGFWERTVGDTQLDVVFLVDGTSSMSEAIQNIRSEVDKFIDRLLANRIDFRVAALVFDSAPSEIGDTVATVPFHGVMEVEELREELDEALIAAWEGWEPTVSYDALLFTPWLGFRDDAQKIIVVISDVAPQTVYGTHWYAIDCTAATLSAAELFLNNHPDIQLYYSQDPEPHVSIEYYTDPDINPRAGDVGSGFPALEAMGLATELAWPFRQEQIPLPTAPVTDSLYYLTWETSFEWPGEAEGYIYEITAQVVDPDKPGEFLEVTYTEPVEREQVELVINVTDEEGHPLNDLWGYLYYAVGDRMAVAFNQLGPQNGQIVVEDVPVGTYFLVVQDDGNYSYEYESLRAIARRWIDVPADGLTMYLDVATADREAELAKARGLLKDIGDWGVVGAPFQDFAAEAEAWLDALEADGLTWEEMVAVKRFYVALSGYANISEYAQRQTEGAIADFHRIVEDIRNIIESVEDIQESTDQSWGEALAEGLLDFLYGILTGGEVPVLKEAVETGLEELLVYAGGELLDELKQAVIEQIPLGPYDDLIEAFFLNLTDTEWDNWEPVIAAAEELFINQAVETVVSTVAEDTLDVLFDGLDLESSLEQAIASFVEDVMLALFEGEGFDGVDVALEQFAQNLGDYVLQNGEDHRDEVVAAANTIFDELENQLDTGLLRDFVLSLLREFTLAAIPRVQDNAPLPPTLVYDIDDDAVVAAIVEHCLYQVVLKHYYAEEAEAGMYQALYRAMAYRIPTTDRGDLRLQMSGDFFDYRKIVEPLQNTAWNALSEQEAIESWAQVLEGLVTILEPLSDALDTIADLYPTLEDTADAVDGFIAVLDGIQVLTRAVEFGLKIDCLDTFGNRAQPLYLAIFPDPVEPLVRMNVSPPAHDFGDTDPQVARAALTVTISNTGNQELTISAMTLSDTANYTIEPSPCGSTTPTIPPGGSCSVVVRFDPESNGIFPATLTITCDEADPTTRIVYLNGKGKSGVRGDINYDAFVNAIDVQLVINAALSIEIDGNGDINGDTLVNALDVQLAINAALGIDI